ncbi:Predicted DNA-binding protein, contains Ribbon-helix-helix (RHH) domain [Loktanella fryxellensis]|uniref:Predicted DNA-binding protein, contains Ribbon-helix-helix (RHH) domain n=1 Tax=Loktanella fryxellensis TaxID=245187 RepID=A0A1H8CCB0_9RHOB|nr:ribbon-helix-helix domain-containing protein [Loktanella fryxellensis]SEM92656.1 Predicted DNA-binding protein, contains Ribbon-helix-helix (RHH) domain [Loktanella fryxellensis]
MCCFHAERDPLRSASTTRRVRLIGQSTSTRLEHTFRQILDEIAAGEGMTTPEFMSKLHSEVVELHGEDAHFSSVLRCTCLI